jgi:hypothetical protein
MNEERKNIWFDPIDWQHRTMVPNTLAKGADIWK